MGRGLYIMRAPSNITLLFIDDEISVLNSIRRLLSRRCRDWTIITTTDQHQALDLMDKENIDVLISDILMPGMQGDELLELTAEKHPNIIRVALSAHAESDAVTKALTISHQFISKPFETNQFIQSIKEIIALRNEFNNHQLIERINTLDSLPAMPEIYQKIMATLNNPEAHIKDIGQLISKDVSLSSKILQVINSAYFGMPKKILSISEAVTYLGIDVVKSLCVTSNLFSSYQGLYKSGLSHKPLMDMAIRVGNTAKHIAQLLELDQRIENQSQLAGFLHNLGMVILGSVLSSDYQTILSQYQKGQGALIDIEQQALGTTHNMVGAYLLQLWAIPLPIAHAGAYLYHPQQSLLDDSSPQVTPLTVVHIAKAVDYELNETPYYDLKFFDQSYLELLNLNSNLDYYIKACQPYINKGY